MMRVGLFDDLCEARGGSPRGRDGLCPLCRRVFANDPRPRVQDEQPRPWSRRWMQKRLGVNGDCDE